MSNIHRCTTSAGMEKGMSENFQTILFCFKGYDRVSAKLTAQTGPKI